LRSVHQGLMRRRRWMFTQSAEILPLFVGEKSHRMRGGAQASAISFSMRSLVMTGLRPMKHLASRRRRRGLHIWCKKLSSLTSGHRYLAPDGKWSSARRTAWRLCPSLWQYSQHVPFLRDHGLIREWSQRTENPGGVYLVHWAVDEAQPHFSLPISSRTHRLSATSAAKLETARWMEAHSVQPAH